MSILRELEEHRLRRHGHQTLSNAGKLCDELLSMQVLPWPARRMLQFFRDDAAAVVRGEELPDTE